jgi:STE24 endopeptidase
MMVQFNALLGIFLCLLVGGAVLRWVLTRINVGHLLRSGHVVPEVFRGELDEETLSRMTRYTVESSRLNAVEALAGDAALLAVLLAGVLPWFAARVESLHFSMILSGLLFFAALALADTLLDIPFSLKGTFGIEKKYGFSTITPGLWISDFLKNLVIAMVIMGMLLGPLLALIQYAPRIWWFWAWLFFALFQMLLLWLYPLVIAPIFNKYEPVRNEELKERIVSLMEKVGLRVQGVYQVDASRRSRHSNAYFTGMGKTKRIVLFDTLLESHAADEIIAVLAHEVGHWKKRHILKQLVLIEAVSLVTFYTLSRFLQWPLLYSAFGFDGYIPYAGLFLVGVMLKTALFFLTPIGAALSRAFEREADDYSFFLLGTARPLADALKRLAKENLANLHPHPFYAWYYYSHPPLTERIARLQQMEAKGS